MVEKEELEHTLLRLPRHWRGHLSSDLHAIAHDLSTRRLRLRNALDLNEAGTAGRNRVE